MGTILLILYCLDVLYTADDFVALNKFAALGNEVREMCFTIETRVDTVLENTETITIVINVDREATPDNVVVRLTSTTILISEWNQPPELFVAYFLIYNSSEREDMQSPNNCSLSQLLLENCAASYCASYINTVHLSIYTYCCCIFQIQTNVQMATMTVLRRHSVWT